MAPPQTDSIEADGVSNLGALERRTACFGRSDVSLEDYADLGDELQRPINDLYVWVGEVLDDGQPVVQTIHTTEAGCREDAETLAESYRQDTPVTEAAVSIRVNERQLYQGEEFRKGTPIEEQLRRADP